MVPVVPTLTAVWAKSRQLPSSVRFGEVGVVQTPEDGVNQAFERALSKFLDHGFEVIVHRHGSVQDGGNGFG